MADLLKNPLASLCTSFALFLIALPLISIGATDGPRLLLWIGLLALCVGGLIPPLQRLVFALQSPSAAQPDGTAKPETERGQQ